ncbi:MFS transporter [Virgisporangium ochraceum]|uniref:MFS transporter n=1 Tax=Virgisporangium ochraceum TaxID=65505 RepID=A0A8J4ECX9_9ACTN|nr:MFS transporter [Virgisporangium ochraceum]GIJ70945.1 MFS transporter [Virgisporangium ochraceum]
MTTYGGVLAEPRFRAVFVCRLLAVAAETLRILALSVLVYDTTGSPFLGALAFGAGFVPQAFGGVLIGALADRAPPRPLIVAGHLVAAATTAALAAFPLPAGWCIAVVAAAAFVAPVFSGASGRVVAIVLTGDGYVLGRSLLGMTGSAAQLVGLAAGGAALATLGARPALALGSAACVAAAVWSAVGLRGLVASSKSDGTLVSASWRGTVLLWHDRTVRRLLLAMWLPSTLLAGAEALFVSYVGADKAAVAPMFAAVPVGMFVGNVVVGRFVDAERRERLAAPLVVLMGAPLTVLVVTPPLPVTLVLLVASGAGLGYSLGLQRQFRDAVPERLQGLSFTLLSTGLMTVQGMGPVVTGVLAEWTGAAPAIALAGLATVATAPLARYQPCVPGPPLSGPTMSEVTQPP